MKIVDIFPWNEHFNTGLKTVDKQHKKLVEILNNLASHIAYNSNEKNLNIIFDELTNYTLYHFETEEAIWHKYLPNDALDEEHQAIHQQFIDTVIKLKEKQKTRPLIEVAEEALGFLARWLASHILETDRHMAYLIFALRDGLNINAAKQKAIKDMSGSTRLLIDIILSIYETLSSNTLHLMRELKVHQKLEKKVHNQDLYRDILLELSTKFINLPLDKIDYNINKALEKMANFVDADRAYIFDYDEQMKSGTNTYEWCKEGIKAQIEELKDVSVNFAPKWPISHAKGEYILIEDVKKLDEEPLKELLSSQDIKSLVTFPLFENSKCIGFIGFDAVRKKHNFTNKEISILEIFSKLLGNIAERRRKESELSHERNLFEHYLNTVEAIIISLDSKGYITLVNRKACEVFGYTKEELLGQLWFDKYLTQPEGMDKVYPAFLEIIKGRLEGAEYFENSILTKSKGKRLIAWHNSFLLDKNSNIIGTLSSGEDITLFREQQNRLEHMAHFDTLTNLPNRILLSDRLYQSILYTQRYKSSLAIIYLDLDGFKEINDTYGHSNGDILLKTVSNRMQEILRESDTIARLGGDEFVIVLHDLKNKKDCIPMLKRILGVVSTPVISNEIEMQVSASIGVTFFNQNDTIDADQLLRQADHAMYQAKLSGKNRFHIFDIQEDIYLRNHNENLEEINNALRNNQFIMYYQPKINMRSGKFLGVEALIRWKHPKKGILSPQSFLPIIENHHLSIEIDSWVLENVIQQIQKWKKDGLNIVVSINISPLQLQENNFINNILNLLEKYPEVRTSDFIFEILETSALEDMSQTSYIMKECNNIGIDFSLDDFGTGYSSLSYLKGLPAKQLKIDKSFVQDMLDDTDDMAILEGVIGLANAFRREVIAEGVENIEQGKMLLRLGCEQAQGYIIAKPMPQEELLEWIKAWKPCKQWQNIPNISKDQIAIIYAMTEHKTWIKELISYLKKERTEAPVLSHKQCYFGTWLYKKDTKKYVKKEDFNKIEKLHNEIHNNINTIINQYKTQAPKNIESLIKEIHSYRDKFIEEFSRIFHLD